MGGELSGPAEASTLRSSKEGLASEGGAETLPQGPPGPLGPARAAAKEGSGETPSRPQRAAASATLQRFFLSLAAPFGVTA
eukprot:8148375-Pyramimonas_sp.AAC.1